MIGGNGEGPYSRWNEKRKKKSKAEFEITARLKEQCARSNLVLKGFQVILGVKRAKTRREIGARLRRGLNSRG